MMKASKKASIEIRVLGSGEGAVLEHVAPGVFDHAVDPHLSAEFLAREGLRALLRAPLAQASERLPALHGVDE